jgi:ribosomal protein L11 methyltransferase
VVRATGPADDADVVAAALLAAGASAVAEETADVDAGGGAGAVLLTADVRAVPAMPPGWSAEVDDVERGAGLDGWRSHARAVRAGERVVLQPPWLAAEHHAPGDVVVLLDPGHAFGSGSHPSTRLAVTMIQQVVRGGEHVLDVGCGSGVLTVTALLLGASSALAVDVEEAALHATRAVSEANGVAERVEIDSRPVAEVTDTFDLVVANISAATLVELAPALGPRVGEAGSLVLAGFLRHQVDDVRTAYGDLREAGRSDEEDWVALLLAR